jgi:surface carbohydrate biosynthesis protein (TIGR04326 family)
MPQPNLTALNGKVAVDAYLSAGFPKNAIIECEALRYGYLSKIKAGSRKPNRRGEVKVLILGDYLPSHTIKMLQLLEKALPQIKVSAKYTIKPHPNYMVELSDYPSLNLEVIMGPFEEILDDFDIAFSTNLTSAALDTYLAGLQVVVMQNEAGVNFSPLRGKSDVSFVSTPEELAKALQMVRQNKADRLSGNDFFFLDPELSRWRKLLAPISSA